jgi:hypothetical protein
MPTGLCGFSPIGKDERDRRCRVDRASDAKECKGKFASGRTSELVDSDVMFRGFSAGEDSKGTRISQYFVVPRDKGGFVVIAVGAGSATQGSKNLQSETDVSDLRQVAWTAAH